jgi:transcriptional regulator with XRE-family HTH domain
VAGSIPRRSDEQRRAGTSQPAVSAYESGTRSPSVDTLCRLVAAAGFEIRMRLERPDTHDAARRFAEALLPQGQVAAHAAAEQRRISDRAAR